MKKLITPFSEYPNALRLANGLEVVRDYVILPTRAEIETLHKERLEVSDSVDYTTDTLIVGIFINPKRKDLKFWKFGCGFCDCASDLEKLERYETAYFRAFLDKYNKGHLSNKGLNWLFMYYLDRYNYYKDRI